MIHAAERAGIELRDAGPADVPAITSIYAHAVRHGTASFEIDPPDEAEIWRRMQSLQAGDFPFIVADANGVVTGYAYAGPYRTRPAYRYSVEDSVYVHPKAFRRGVGRALLARLIEDSAAHGFRQMIAVIGDSTQQTPSIELHRALGFRTIGAIANVGFKGGRWLDSVLMQLALGPGATTKP